MKSIVLYSAFLLATLATLVRGSEYLDQNITEPVLSEQPEEKDPEYVKLEFYFQVINGNIASVKNFIDKYDYLTQRFNADIFSGLLTCFRNKEGSKHDDCMEIFEMLKPSFGDVSESNSSPLIHAIIYGNMEIVNALLTMPEAKEFVDKVDQFGRTALMYAAKSGSEYALAHIIIISAESINLKDRDGKTALHYVCEMNPPISKKETLTFGIPKYLSGETDFEAEKKWKMFRSIFIDGAKILSDGPKYKLSSSDSQLADFIIFQGGKVQIEAGPEDLAVNLVASVTVTSLIKALGLTHLTTKAASSIIGFILANPVMLALNYICYVFQNMIIPGIDMNFVISLDLGDGFQDISFNILFVMLMAVLIKNIMEKKIAL